MPITIVERYGSRLETVGAQITAERLFVILGAEDAAAAIAALAGDVGASTYNGIRSTEVGLTEQVNNTTWFGAVRYATQSPATTTDPTQLPTPVPSIVFDTAGGQQLIRNNRLTVSSGGIVPSDTGGAINFDGDNVNGVEIYIPGFQFEYTRYYTPEDFGPDQIATIAGLTAKINNATFDVFSAGSVLFLGGSGRRRQVAGVEGMWEVTYKFSMIPNQIGIYVGDLGPIDKFGWDYLEIRYDNKPDSTIGRLVKVPVGYIVHGVYDMGNFGDLPI